MKLIINPCILILTIVSVIAVFGCGDSQTSPTTSNPVDVSSGGTISKPNGIVPDEVIPPIEDEVVPDEVIPPIEDEVVPDEVIPPVVLGKDDRVTVKNTLEDGLRIRDAPNGNRIGGMFDGEIGTIISEGKIDDGLVWFEIEWEAPVKNPNSGCGIGKKVCIGWSVAVLRDGTEVLERLK